MFPRRPLLDLATRGLQETAVAPENLVFGIARQGIEGIIRVDHGSIFLVHVAKEDGTG